MDSEIRVESTVSELQSSGHLNDAMPKKRINI